jgi:hypothetical protein
VATSGELCSSVAKALGISFETTREHLRNLRRVDETITFKGYGRGAAQMTPLDATRLLIAAAGSSFVKESLQTLHVFQSLRSIAPAEPMRPDRPPRTPTPDVSLEDYIALVIQRLIDLKGRLPASYQRPPHEETQTAAIALTLMSVVDSDLPRAAVVRYRGSSGNGVFAGAMSFAVPKLWSYAVSNVASYGHEVGRMGSVGLIQTRNVPAWALAEIAHSLVS